MLATHPNESSVVKPGALAPSFTLSNTDGTFFSLSQAVTSGPIVLVFYRGDW